MLRKLVPCLWFDGQAEEAARFYVSVFDGSRITHVARYGEAGRSAAGSRTGTASRGKSSPLGCKT